MKFNWLDPDRADWIPAWVCLAGLLAAAAATLPEGLVAAWQVLRSTV